MARDSKRTRDDHLTRDTLSPDVVTDHAGVLHVQSLEASRPQKSTLHRLVERLHRAQHSQVVEGLQGHMHSRAAHITVGVVSATKMLDPFCAASVCLSAAKLTATHSGHDHHHGHGHHGHGHHGHGHHGHGHHGHGHDHHGKHGRGHGHHQPSGEADAAAPVVNAALQDAADGDLPPPAVAGTPLIRPEAEAHKAAQKDPAPFRADSVAPSEDIVAAGPISGLKAKEVKLQSLNGPEEGGVTARILGAVKTAADHPMVKGAADLAHKAIHNPYVMGGATLLYGYLAVKTGAGLDLASLPDTGTMWEMAKMGVYSVVAASAGGTTVELLGERALNHLNRQHEERLETHRKREEAVVSSLIRLDPAWDGPGPLSWQKQGSTLIQTANPDFCGAKPGPLTGSVSTGPDDGEGGAPTRGEDAPTRDSAVDITGGTRAGERPTDKPAGPGRRR